MRIPRLWCAVDDASVLVAGEAEADEPLAIELPRRVLQQRHSPPVVLDQVVVGREDVGDAILNLRIRTPHLDLMENVSVHPRHGGLVALVVPQNVFKEVSDKMGAVALEI